MLFGNLDLENINESLQSMYSNNSNTYGKKSTFSKILTTLSHYGMNWDDDVLKNMKAIPQDKSLLLQTDKLDFGSLYKGYYETLQGHTNDNENKSFFEKDLKYKLKMLHALAQLPELENIVDIMADECIVYDDDYSYIALPFIDISVLQTLNENSQLEITNAMTSQFYRIYEYANWHERAWHIFKLYLIEGVLAYEIIYDDLKNPKNVVGMVQLDPSTLTKEVRNGITYWIQYKGVMGQERVLIDAQIVYIKYEDTGTSARLSYLERLIRPFNIYRIIEQAQIIWTVTQASFKTVFTIPVGGMNRAKGTQTLNTAMNRYKENIKFNMDSGELTINGKVNQPFNKEYWFPENASGTPKLETLVDNGPALHDSEQLKWYKNDLYKVSKIPFNRFDNESQSTWFGSDPTQTLREEIEFSRFVLRIRYEFAKIILKPLRIQMSLQIPNLKNDKRILNAVKLRFNTYNQFEEMMNIEISNKRIEYITNMSNIQSTDGDGNQRPFFSMKYLVKTYLHLSDAELAMNERYKLEEIEPTEENFNSEEELGGEENGGALPDTTSTFGNDGGGIDAEMMGDVQPESPHTTTTGGNRPPQQEPNSNDGSDINTSMMGDVQPLS